MNVLSLFDGIGTGRYALDKAGIKVDKYYASEIDKKAISIAQYNYPDIIQIGDVESIDFNSLKGKIDLIIGGFPCTDLSLAGKRDGLKGQHSRLFYKQLEAIKIIQPKYFLVENNVGMPKKAYEEISKQLGCYPVEINSALVSAQSRKRYYWTNIGPKMRGLVGLPKCAIPQPKDRGIILEDILEKDINIIPENTTSVSYVEKHLKSLSDKLGYTPVQFNAYNEQEIKEKSPTLTTVCGSKTSSSSVNRFLLNYNVIQGINIVLYSVQNGTIKIGDTVYPINLPDGDYSIRHLTPLECERLQTMPDGYTQFGREREHIVKISNAQRYKALGNGWTAEVIIHIFRFMEE